MAKKNRIDSDPDGAARVSAVMDKMRGGAREERPPKDSKREDDEEEEIDDTPAEDADLDDEGTGEVEPEDDDDDDDDAAEEGDADDSEDDAESDDGEDEPEDKQQESPDEFTQDLLDYASDYGFNEADARDYGTARALRVAIKRERAQREQRSRAAGANGNGNGHAAQEEKDELEEKLAVKKFEAEYDPEDGQSVRDYINKMNEHYATETTRVARSIHQTYRQQVSGLKSAFRDVAGRDAMREFDGLIKDLGKPYQETFGTGATLTMQKTAANTVAYQNRVRLFKQFHAQAQMYGEGVDPAELFRKALSAEFRNEEKKRHRSEITDKLRSQGRRTIPKPSPTRSDAPRPKGKKATAARERAAGVNRVAEVFRKHKMRDE